MMEFILNLYLYFGRKKWLVLASTACTIFAALATKDSVQAKFNFGSTLEWYPGDIRMCSSVDQVLEVVEDAKSSGKRVKAFGTGWSWSTTIAGDGDTYIKLTGDLADATKAKINTSPTTDAPTPSATVGAGVLAFDLYLQLQNTGYNIEAKGNCLTADESQTVGGLLATNVHHTGIRSFYDVVEWVEVVTAESGLVRTLRDEPLFRLTIGGAGRTGVIVNVRFNLTPRDTYERVNTDDITQPENDTFEAFFQGFVDLTSPYEPMEFIAYGIRPPGLARLANVQPPYSAWKRMAEPSAKSAILPADFGNISIFAKSYLKVDPCLDFVLPSFVYDTVYLAALFIVLPGKQPQTEGTTGVDLDVASSDTFTVRLKHQELEFFVPVDLLGQVGAYMDYRFDDGCYPYIRDHGLFALRKVFGCNSLTAANGVLADGSSPDFIAVNIDSYQRKRWEQYNAELNTLLADLSTEFPEKIRTHPGKYNAPLSPNPEPQSVKDMIAAMDPQGAFARDGYDPTYLTATPDNDVKCS